jgi:predicted nucleotidyltransferase
MFQQLLETLALALDSRSIAYMLIGGQAVLLYGEPRLTQDVDVTLGIGPQQLDDLLAVINPLGWQVLVADAPAFVKKTLVLPCLAQPWGIRVDFIFSYTPYEQQAIQRARRVQVGQAQVCYASLEDLIIHKLVAGRARDLEDAAIILTKNPDIDLPYLRNWLRQFEDSLERPLSDQFEELWNAAR